MIAPQPDKPVGLLLSGGLDSAILLHALLMEGFTVQPFYIRSYLAWETQELHATRSLLATLSRPELRELVVLEMPTEDLYGNHWSVTGQNVPDARTPDEAVYLPGRNALLLLKAALWCQMHDVPQIALAPLKSNPFPDASDEFFAAFERTLRLATQRPISIWRPFATLAKPQVMQLGRQFPWRQTFSCIAPVENLHCGCCNKCHERQVAFAAAQIEDPTVYASHGLEPKSSR